MNWLSLFRNGQHENLRPLAPAHMTQPPYGRRFRVVDPRATPKQPQGIDHDSATVMNAAKIVPSVIQYQIDFLSLLLSIVISVSSLRSVPRMAKS